MSKGIVNKEIEKIYPLTPLQHGMLYHHLLEEDSTGYVVQSVFHINFPIKDDLLELSLRSVEKRHEVLKTSVVYEKVKKPAQVILKSRQIEYKSLDYTQLEDKELQQLVSEYAEKDVIRKFDLQKDPLIRITNICLPNNQHKLVWTVHHIILDGWCLSVIFGDFIKYYNYFNDGMTIEEVEEIIEEEKRGSSNYSDYVKWISKQEDKGGYKYWSDILSDYDESAKITPLIKPEETNKQVERLEQSISKDVSEQIIKMAAAENITVNTVIQTIWGILLQQYSGSDDVVFGKVVSGRNVPLRGIENIVGLFVNTVPCRLETKKEDTVLEILHKVQEQNDNGADYEHFSLANIQSLIPNGRDMIQTLYVFENYFIDQDLIEEQETKEISIDQSREQTNYDITVIGDLDNNNLSITIMYNPNIYVKGEIKNILDHFEMLLNYITNNMNSLVTDLPLALAEEKDQIINIFNDTKTNYPKDKTVIGLFEDQVERYKDNIAIVHKEESLTYKELNNRANAIGNKLRELGVLPDDFVAIIAERNLEVMVGILGILKAGGAYVPIDPAYPNSRIQYILEDCKPKAVLLYQTDLSTDIPTLKLTDKDIWRQEEENLNLVNTPEDLAYCMYTSGTTGKPKGSLIENKSIIRLVRNNNYLPLDDSTIILQIGSISFDASTLEIWGSLLNGGKLILPENETVTDNVKMKEIINKHQINTMFITTSLFNQMIQTDPSLFDNVKYLLFGGEKASEHHIHIIRDRDTSTKLINCYGPTENTTFTTTTQVAKKFDRLSIGKPISNTNVYIVNGDRLCGIGIPGELCISGDGLARGYLNKEELTKEKFIDNKYGQGKLYYSGDMARWLPDGNIDFLGRIDDQVKIRGFRIELGEIEKAIMKVKDIKDCAVIVKDFGGNEKSIFAYIVSEKDISVSKIKDLLSETLPDYMIPTYIMQIDEIPVNINGKLDKKALPDIKIESEQEYIPPNNETEGIICELFSEILGVEEVGIKDNFFELGGHSLLATRLVNQIEGKTGKRIGLKEIFTSPTPEQLAGILLKNKDEKYEAIPKSEEKELYEMSSTQKRTYIICQMDPNSTAYNIPMILKFTGEGSYENLKDAFAKILDRHEILRTGFIMEDGKLYQKIYDNVQANVEYEKNTELNERELLKDFIRPFELSKPPLVRLKLAKRKDGYILLFDMHHIIGDGVSLSIFQNELIALYNGEKLLSLKRQYRDYSEWMEKKDLSKQRTYWKSQFEDSVPVLDFPLDKPRLNEQSLNGNIVKKISNSILIDQVNETAKQYGTTSYMIYLAGAMILLGRYSRQEDIVIGSPISARSHKDLEGMLGMFVNTLAMRGQPKRNKTFESFLMEIKESSLNAYENQEYPFEELVDDIDVSRELSRNPLFDVMLVLQNFEDGREDIKDANFEEEGIKEGYDSHITKFDLTFNLSEESGRLKLFLEYCTDLFFEDSARKIGDHYFAILDQVTKTPKMNIKDLNFNNHEDRIKILEEFNDTDLEYSQFKTFIELFEDQVEKTPDKIALEYEDESLTYRQLNNKANILGKKLREKGIGRNDLVAIIAVHSIEMVIGIYGVLKAGAAYVPMDPNYPQDRIAYMLEDCCPRAVIVYKYEKPLKSSEIIDLEKIKDIDDETDNPININKDEDLVYCIYTSGTTGKPKGVMIKHGNLYNYLEYGKKAYIVDDIIAPLFTSISFDLTVTTLFLPLSIGGKIFVKDDVAKTINEIFSEDKYTFAKMTPSHLKMASLEEDKQLKQLNTLIIGGEELESSLTQEILDRFGSHIKIHNEYGPTETTVGCCDYIYKESDKEVSKGVSIGKAINNTKIYVMDEENLCGINVPGELCITGSGVSKGYLNKEELTDEKFVKNPFGQGKMYRSGDLARWTPKGSLEYLGRIDEQVKIRGYRIELGEIENSILEYPGVTSCVVTLKDTKANDKAICAYIITKEETNIETLLEWLKQRLPIYMIPSYIGQIDSIPVTQNGKLDKKALPDMEIRMEEKHVEAKTDKEKVLCEVIAEILGLEKIGTTENFFDIGGDSLKAVRIVSMLREKGYNLAINDIFRSQKISIMSKYITKTDYSLNGSVKKTNKVESIEFPEEIIKAIEEGKQKYQDAIFLNEIKEKHPLSPMQEFTVSNIKNYSGGIIEFSHDLDLELIKKALLSTVNAQEVLRCKISTKDNEGNLVFYNKVEEIPLTYIDLSTSSKESKSFIKDYVQENIFGDLVDNYELLHYVLLVRYEKENYKMYFSFNSVVFDGMSMEVLKSNILQSYNNNGILPDHIVVEPYSQYLEQIKKGPVNVTANEMIKSLNISKFQEGLKHLGKAHKEESYQFKQLTFELGKDVSEFSEEELWYISYKMFIKVIDFNFKIPVIPFGLTVSAREYEDKNYYSTIGEFIDFIPFAVDKDEILDLKTLKEYSKFKSSHNINIMSLLLDKAYSLKFFKLLNKLKGIKENLPYLPIFNYLGIYESLASSEDEFDTVDEVVLIEDMLMIIGVFTSGNKIIIGGCCGSSGGKEKMDKLENELSIYLQETLESI